MKFIFETEDEQEALIYQNAPKFYAALYEIRELLRTQEKYGYTLSEGKSSGVIAEAYKEKINTIIGDEAPGFYEVI